MKDREYFFGKANAEMHSILSCGCGFIRNYFINAFPENYFKNIFITTRIASNELDDSTESPLSKTSKPILSITPRFDMGLDSSVMGLLPNFFYSHSGFLRDLHGNYPIVFHNDEKLHTIAALPDRYKIDFEIKIKVDSYLKLLRLANFVRRRLWINRPFYVNEVPFETEIPKSMIKILIDELGVDSNDSESKKEFNEYIERFSKNSVKFKKVLSTGNNAHVYNYITNVLCRIESISMDDYNREGQIEEYPILTIGIWIEFWAPATYIFKSINRLPPIDIEEGTSFDMENEFSLMTLNSVYTPVAQKTIGNFSLLDWSEYMTDQKIGDEEKHDTLDISGLIGSDLKLLIDYIYSKNENVEEYFMGKLYLDYIELDPDKDYKINYRTLTLTNYNPRYSYKYHFSIYADLKKVKDKLEKMYLEKNLMNLFQKSYTKEFEIVDNKLKVTFNNDIDNSIISLNGYFPMYELVDSKTIIFDETSSFNIDVLLEKNIVKVFNWEDIELENILNPIKRNIDVLIFEEKVPDGSILFYNEKIIHIRKDFGNNRIKIMDDLDFNNAEFDLNKFYLYVFSSKDNKSISSIQLKGKNTSVEKLKFFNVDINRSIITVDGILNEYDINVRSPRLITYVGSLTSMIHLDSKLE